MFKRLEKFEGSKPAKGIWAIVMLLLILAVVTAIRIRLMNMPLERDEGEFAYAGQVLLAGVSPYEAAYNAALKLPGTFVMYAFFMAIFGQTATAIHAGVILINLVTAWLVFVLARRMCGTPAGVVAAGTYALLSINPAVMGLAAHATHFVMLAALAGIVLLQNLDEKTSARRIFFAGLLLGLGVIMKQTGAFFGLFAAVWVARCEFSSESRRWNRLARRLAWLALGGFLPFILTCLVAAVKGDFGRFWFWAFQYAGAHGAIFTLTRSLQWMFINLGDQFAAAPGLWSLAALGFLLLFFQKSLKRWRFFLVSFALFSFLAVCPGGYFRGHYFIQVLPVAGLMAAVLFQAVSAFLARRDVLFLRQTPALIFAVATISALIQWSNVYFFLTPVQACRAIYGSNPFPEAVEISRYLAEHCAPEADILVMGSEPEIYFYSHRRSATGYICTYPLVEPQPYAAAMQKEMIQQVEQADPAYVVYVNVPASWIQSTVPPNKNIFDWFEKYRQERLQLVGTVEILPDGQSQYRWFDPQTTLPSLSSQYWVAIFKNRTAAQIQPLKSN
jgi:Dolichyl-phosphate-mannose-protein mannosyltransferase